MATDQKIAGSNPAESCRARSICAGQRPIGLGPRSLGTRKYCNRTATRMIMVSGEALRVHNYPVLSPTTSQKWHLRIDHGSPLCQGGCRCPGLGAPWVSSVQAGSACRGVVFGGVRGGRERDGEWSGIAVRAGVFSAAAGPGSDFSEAPALGFEPAALESVAAPTCPPGPASSSRFWSATSWR